MRFPFGTPKVVAWPSMAKSTAIATLTILLISLIFFLVSFLVIWLCVFVFILVFTHAHVIVHAGTAQLTVSGYKVQDGKEGVPIYKRSGSSYNFHYRLSEIRTQDFIVCELMHHNK
jgi:hypothetical protein